MKATLSTRDLVARTALAISAAVFAATCASSSPTAPTSTSPQAATVSIMGATRLTPEQLVAWFSARQPGTGSFAATVPVATLAQYFIEEGAAERVGGDVAFVQSIVETGWFRFAGVVRASSNNFAGIGATDTNPAPAMFPDARTGVRAQIQHLRAYGDPTASTCTVPPLANSCVDPRFQLVTPKGKAPTWNQMGNGNWASASTYASSILALYADALAFNGARALSAREADVDQRGIVIRNPFGPGRIRSQTSGESALPRTCMTAATCASRLSLASIWSRVCAVPSNT